MKTNYLLFDTQLYQTAQIFREQLITFWQQGRMQECREFSALLNKPLAEINKYLRLWGLGW